LDLAGEKEIKNQKSKIKNQISIRVVSSAGTYIRTLAEDIGKKIGIGAHLASLRRTRAGSFSIEKAITLNELEELAETGQIEKKLVSLSEALAHFPKLILSDEEVKRTANGMAVFVNQRTCENWDDEQFVRLCDKRANLVSVGVYRKSERSLRPKIVLLK
jgi:tRNA pseudouridine55 synthase